MRLPIATFARRVSKIVLTALCLATWLAAAQVAQAAYGVSANQIGDTLYIVGNENPNTVSIVGAEDELGTVGVYVVDVPWVYEGVNHIHVDLGEGDNFLGMDRINILGTLTVQTGEGDDEVDLGGWGYGASNIGGDLDIATGGGRDTVQIEDTSVLGSVTIDTGAGSDIVELGDDGFLFTVQENRVPGRTAGGDALRAAEGGGTELRGADDLSAVPNDDDGDLVLSLALTGGLPNSFGELYVFTESGRDLVGITLTQVDVATGIELGSDDDGLQLEHPNHFYGDFAANGQQGQDNLSNDPGNFYENDPQFQSF